MQTKKKPLNKYSQPQFQQKGKKEEKKVFHMANFDNFVGYKKTMGVTYNAPHKDLFYFKCLEAR